MKNIGGHHYFFTMNACVSQCCLFLHLFAASHLVRHSPSEFELNCYHETITKCLPVVVGPSATNLSASTQSSTDSRLQEKINRQQSSQEVEECSCVTADSLIVYSLLRCSCLAIVPIQWSLEVPRILWETGLICGDYRKFACEAESMFVSKCGDQFTLLL